MRLATLTRYQNLVQQLLLWVQFNHVTWHSTQSLDIAVVSFIDHLMQPHEGFELLTQSLVPPNPVAVAQYDAWAIIINDAFAGRAGKTGLMDESVVIDNDRILWPVLAALRLARPLPGPLWTFAPHHYRHMWLWAVDRLSL